jgi:GTP-binding protein
MIVITESEFIKSAVKPEHYVFNSFSDFAFVGKSNVGKSSLINALLNRKKIAKISSTPGKTKLIQFFKVRYKKDALHDGFVNFVDLPGYGYAKVSKKERESWKKMLSLYFTNRPELKGVVLLIDIRHTKDLKDEMMVEMLRLHSIPFLLVATKADKIGTKAESAIKKLAIEFQVEATQIISVSSKTKKGLAKILDWMEKRMLEFS